MNGSNRPIKQQRRIVITFYLYSFYLSAFSGLSFFCVLESIKYYAQNKIFFNAFNNTNNNLKFINKKNYKFKKKNNNKIHFNNLFKSNKKASKNFN
jgi:hypothetical protein